MGVSKISNHIVRVFVNWQTKFRLFLSYDLLFYFLMLLDSTCGGAIDLSNDKQIEFEHILNHISNDHSSHPRTAILKSNICGVECVIFGNLIHLQCRFFKWLKEFWEIETIEILTRVSYLIESINITTNPVQKLTHQDEISNPLWNSGSIQNIRDSYCTWLCATHSN